MLETDYYSYGVIRLTTLQKQKGQPGQLVFASIHLLPKGRLPPAPMKDLHQFSISKTETLAFRRTTLSADAALDWYRSINFSNNKTPIPTQQDAYCEKYDGVGFESVQLTDDPAWPLLGVPISDSLFSQSSEANYSAPFVGSSPARIHRRLSLNPQGFDNFLSNEKAISFVARRLHIDLKRYPEYLGGLALIAPDPVLKKITCFMIPASDERGERIFYRFVPRPDAKLDNLTLTTLDIQNTLLTGLDSHQIPSDGILDIPKGNCVGQYGYVLTHSNLGVIAHSSPHGFLRQIDISTKLVEPQIVKVKVPTGASPKSPHMEYSKQREHAASQLLIGDEARIETATQLVGNSVRNRQKLLQGKQLGQRWFPNGSREEVMRFVQSELRKAKHRVVIVDPYFGELQLPQFLFAISPQIDSLILLTSRKAFDNGLNRMPALAKFEEQMNELVKHQSVTPMVYVLKEDVLHDRFLVVDETVWLLGNSLNALGENASVMVKLPNPDEAIKQIENLIADKADQFQEYVKTAAPPK